MLVTEKCVFLHMPKTGGHFCRSIIETHAGKTLHSGGWHAPYKKLPANFHHLPILIVVRNPWDWYVSWYHYMIDVLETGHPNPLIVNATMNTPPGFNNVMSYVFKSMRTGTKESKQLAKYLKSERHIASKAKRPGIRDLDKEMIENMRKKNHGFLSWRFESLLAGTSKKLVRYIEFDNLNSQLLAALSEIGVSIPEEEKNRILSLGKVNAGATRKGEEYRRFYESDAVKNAIAYYDRNFIRLFSYEF